MTKEDKAGLRWLSDMENHPSSIACIPAKQVWDYIEKLRGDLWIAITLHNRRSTIMLPLPESLKP